MTPNPTPEQQNEIDEMVEAAVRIERFVDQVLESRIIVYNRAVGNKYPTPNYSAAQYHLECDSEGYSVPFVDRHEFETEHFGIPYVYAHMSNKEFVAEMDRLATIRDQQKLAEQAEQQQKRDQADYNKMLELQKRFADKKVGQKNV